MKVLRTGGNLLLGLMLIVAAGQASAQQAQQDGGMYFGAIGGWMMPDDDRLDDAVNVGALIGYEIPGITALPGAVGVEGEITTTIVQGDVSGGDEWDATTLAAYGVYRTGGALYGKGKLGLVHQTIDVEGRFGTEDEETGLSWGLGGGMQFGGGRIEVMYSWLEDDINFLTLGYIF